MLKIRNIRRFLLIFFAFVLMAAGACAEYYRVLRPGESSADVKNMQQALAFLQYAVRLDGVYDAQTEQAVTAFQKARNLTADGKAGSATLSELFRLAPQFKPGAIANQQPTAAPQAQTVPDFAGGIYRLGDEAEGVRTLQQRLKDLGYPISRADAVYGYKTKEAVALFQAANGLKADGKAGPGTMKLLFSSSARRAPAQTAAPAPTTAPLPSAAPAPTKGPAQPTDAPNVGQVIPNRPSGTYRLGNEAAGVRVIQQRLIDLGYPIARADAVYGPKTRDAVAMFQTLNGLKADGTAGETTLSRLFSASAKRAGSLPTATAQPTAAPTVPPTENLGGGQVATAVVATTGKRTLNFRSQPNTSGLYFIAAIPHGETLPVFSIGDTWCRVQYKGRMGYVMTKFLAISKTGETPAPTEAPAPTAAPPADQPSTYVTLKIDSRDGADKLVTLLQQRLKALGYALAVDGVFGTGTHDAVVSFQQINGLKTTGIADVNMQKLLYSDSAKPYTAGGGSTGGGPQGSAPGNVKLLHWFKEVKPSISAGQRLIVYHPASGASFTLRAYSLGRHMDAEPLTLADTQRMNKAFGAPSWNVNAVYVKLPNGAWTLATMHNRPHLSGSISDNGFDGHLCVHFLRDMAEAQKNDPNYGVTNQKVIRNTWKNMTGETLDY